MKIRTSELTALVLERDRTYEFNPVNLKFAGLTEEEKTWTKIIINERIIKIAERLHEEGISDWCWKDLAPDRMVFRNTIYFRNPEEAILFALKYDFNSDVNNL